MTRVLTQICYLMTSLVLTGCASITNPVADGIPVRKLPGEFLAKSREEQTNIPLSLLRQQPPDVYRLAPGDILGVYIDEVLADKDQNPPVRFAEQSNVPPAMGYPIPVAEDGTISLPYVEPIQVDGKTLAQTSQIIREAFTVKRKVLKAGNDRILVTLMEPRRYRVLVLRPDSNANQSSNSISFAGGIVSGNSEALAPRQRGQGVYLELPAYENDVLNALTRTGGLPGPDAKNEVIIQRNSKRKLDGSGKPIVQLSSPAPTMIRIPLKAAPGESLNFTAEDVILQNGDIVLIESREAEVFYTGGLLPPGQYPLPRDYDLDVVQAISLVRGPLVNGAFNQNNFTGQTQVSGIGLPNPSLLTVIRQLPDGDKLSIRVDLNRALYDHNECLKIKPKDVLVLQASPGEGLTQYLTTIIRYSFLGNFLRERDAVGTVNISAP